MIATLAPTHLSNIESEETLEVDGKIFKKVKLVFVDSLDFKAGQYLEKLETAFEDLVNENDKLTLQFYKQERLLDQYLTINSNLLSQNLLYKSKVEAISKELAGEKKMNKVFENQTEKLTASIAKKIERIVKLGERVTTFETTIAELKNENKKLRAVCANEKQLSTLLELGQQQKKRIEELERHYSSLLQEKKETRPKLERMKERNLDLGEEIKLLKAKVETKQNEINKLNNTIKGLAVQKNKEQ